MPNVLLTYDIRRTTVSIHVELKERLIQSYGYSETIPANDGRHYELPNTTLKKDNITSQASSQEFLQACADVGAVWEKYITAEYIYANFDN
ncbi:hypothetical protein [Ohtaekwangia koreensis]|uniref:Uncharacterized protein n=1 Tax=Ohtaekwangia koreensis TaxID=688867 RepID=A0A1T5K6G2_9BACT|nr:hypothetical protein [Ohtaekwangia koreensis]SKC59125.1 hypothetical protein SAMN05660236_1852 [Ohtaekwangia koreensis]